MSSTRAQRADGARAPSRPRSGARRGRGPASLFAALLYLVLVLVLPGLHISFHRDDHAHPGGGLQRTTAAFLLAQRAGGALHAHGAGIEHAHPQAGPEVGRAHLTAPAGHAALLPARSHQAPGSDLAHGAGSLAHFAGVLLPGAAALDLPLAGMIAGEADPLPPPYAVPRDTLRSALRARAPPPKLTA